MPETRVYIVNVYIDITGVSPSDVIGYIESAKSSLNIDQELNDLLNAEILTFYIPVRNMQTKIEIHEFFVDDDSPKPKTYYRIETGNRTPKEFADLVDKIKEAMSK